MGKPTVSVIMPTHNDVRFLTRAMDSVLSQSFKDWELLVVDDDSTDDTPTVIAEYAKKDSRIRPFRIDVASGSPTKPRNIGIENAIGRYIAFLDSDDLWLPTKLENQISLFQEKKDAIMVFSNYRKISEDGEQHKYPIIAPSVLGYKDLLKGNAMGCLTITYDTEKTGKQYFPHCGHEDYALWLSMLKQGGHAYNTNTVEALYRLKNSSVSSNKLRTIGWQWHIYREREKLSIAKSLYYFIHYAVRAVNKGLR